MNFYRRKGGSQAFTVVELFVVIIVLFLIGALLLPELTNPGSHKSKRIECVNNLKQIGLTFRLWSGDCGASYPMEMITNAAYGPFELNATNGFRYFQVMSNELFTPGILVCPVDTKRRAATNFTTDFNNSRIGYFVGLDSDETLPQTFLAGDWNLTNGQSKTNGILTLQSNQNVGWTKELHNLAGNIGMGDGSVMLLNNGGLKNALGHTGLETNRLLFP